MIKPTLLNLVLAIMASIFFGVWMHSLMAFFFMFMVLALLSD